MTANHFRLFVDEMSKTQCVVLDASNFDAFIKAPRAIVHFWAAWNAHDKAMRELIEKALIPRFGDRVQFGSFCVDPPEHHALCLRENLVQTPTLGLYRNGRGAASIVGLRSEATIASEIAAFLDDLGP